MGCVCTPGAGPPTYIRWAGVGPPQNRKLQLSTAIALAKKPQAVFYSFDICHPATSLLFILWLDAAADQDIQKKIRTGGSLADFPSVLHLQHILHTRTREYCADIHIQVLQM
jgi:hypothetical protein